MRNIDAPAWRPALLLGVFIGLFLLIFRPFGLNRTEIPAWFILGFGAVAALVFLLVDQLLPRLFPQLWDEEKWTVGKEILSNILLLSLIALCNHLYEHAVFQLLQPDWAYPPNLPYTFLNVVLLGLFPIFAFTLISENRLLQQNLLEAERLNAQLQARQQAPPATTPNRGKASEPLLRIDSNNQNEILQLALDELRYIRSDANYIDVLWVKEETVKRSTLRSSLKKVEEDHGHHPQLMRCHRRYFVNLGSLQSVSGNSRGYKLQLRDVEEEIPVSRSYGPQLRGYLEGQSVPV